MADKQPVRVQDAIDLIKAGKIDDAYDIVARVLKEDLDNAAAWAVLAHLAYTPATPQETIYCLKQVLRLQPDDMQAREYLEHLGASIDRPGQWQAPPPQFPPPLPVDADALFASWHTEPTVETAAPSFDEVSPAGKSGLRRLILVNVGTALIILAAFFVIINPLFQILSPENLPARAAARPTADSPLGQDPPPAVPAQHPTGLPLFPVMPANRPTATPVSDPAAGGDADSTPGPQSVDYRPMIAELESYLQRTVYDWGYDMGVGFVDIETGQVIDFRGDTRYHAMSAFKGPLAVYYLWLTEHGVEKFPPDYEYIQRMLRDSSNADTTCIFQRVGGITSFNDWLAQQGLSRENNFVFKWQDWPCTENDAYYIPEPDWRYMRGDEALGLPGNSALLTCPSNVLPCDKAFAPVELAEFYARLYRNEILDPETTALLLSWLEARYGGSIFLSNIPRQPTTRVYVKGGGHKAAEEYRVNFISEAGIVETKNGAFALAIFMQRNPEWPGNEAMAGAVEIVYDHFVSAHAATTP